MAQKTAVVRRTPYRSFALGSLPKGCRLCAAGKKSVFFITGVCNAGCFFCPISEQKKNNDVIFINERPVKKNNDVIGEINACRSEGVGITGGDPLARIDRTCAYIRKLKERYGKGFHIHLYTPLALVTDDKLKRLHGAGLDEVRFHLFLNDRKRWPILEKATGYSWDVGVEIPVLPKMERATKELIDFIAGKVKFLNLNELEYSDTNASGMERFGYATKGAASYAISGSEELAKRLLCYCKGRIPSVHYCTASLKDSIQMARRIRRRAKTVRKGYQSLTREGMIRTGALYIPELAPGIGYRKQLTQENRKNALAALRAALPKVRELDSTQGMDIDTGKPRITASPAFIRKSKRKLKELGLLPAIVEEYPTWDAFEVSVDLL
ncbi:TPA: radical SAM protein [Candidatus Woesearchaeota archaeon]|nr:radical SAM protein [Candidatus Woesearchaeota archaeon]